MATVTPAGTGVDLRTLARMIRVMFPHDRFPDGPYERAAAGIVEGVQADARMRAQLAQGMVELEAAGFTGMADDKALEYLRGISGSAFFELVRSNTITSLYDDREVWSILGYEGPSHDQGGYLHRGFDDLDWLPTPRIDEAS
jgi:hypothetical protein